MHNHDVLNFSKFFSNKVNAYFLLNPKKESRENNLDEIGLKLENTAIPEQVHGNEIKWVKLPGEYENVDGLISSNPNLILSLKVADCVPVYLFDPKSQIFGLIHSGWRGTKGMIVNEGINLMIKKGAQLKDIKCYLGPSIGQCCYEVGDDVSRFYSSKSKILLDSNKVKLNIKLEIKLELERMGVLAKNINISHLCTFELSKFHSYRRDGLEAGRMYATIMIKNELY
tara:strand:- start:52 stop:732 length:681 start_codon:yes stop_codon:yes gene_type:complete